MKDGSNSNVWKGQRFQDTGILILGESTYGDDEPLTDYIPKWIAGTLAERDYTFSRIFKAAEKLNASEVTSGQRGAFWHSVAFYNFVPGTVGETNKQKATEEHFKQAAKDLPDVLKELKPKAVWILGKTQAKHSQPVVERAGILCEVITHPASPRISSVKLRESWENVVRLIHPSNKACAAN